MFWLMKMRKNARFASKNSSWASTSWRIASIGSFSAAARSLHAAYHLAHLLFKERHIEFLLALEVEVNRTGRVFRRPRHLLHRGLMESVFGEDRLGGFEHVTAAIEALAFTTRQRVV